MAEFLHFNRANIFYPLVANYWLSMIGAADVSMLEMLKLSRHEMFTRLMEGHGLDEANLNALYNIVTHANLKSEGWSYQIDIDYDTYGKEFVQNIGFLLRHTVESSQYILVVAYERCKASGYVINTDPVWEFLRHVRNAAAHGGKFNLQPGQPSRPAQWRGLTINVSLQGVNLFNSSASAKDGLLSPGDPLVLLWDIEQAYPDLKPKELH